MKSSTVRTIIPILYIIVIGFIVGISLLSAVFLSFKYFTKERVDSAENIQREVFSYQQSMIDGETGEITFGAISVLDNILESDAFISYEDKVGNHILISHHGLDEYKCTSTCYCENHDDRRSSSIISTTLKYLVAAISSVVAVNYARDYFEKECEKSMRTMESPSCPIGSVIRSQMDGCQALTEVTPEKGKDEKEAQDQKPKTEDTAASEEEDWGDIHEVGGGWDMMSDMPDFPATNEIGEPPTDVREREYDHYRCHGNCFNRIFKHPLDNQEAERFFCFKLWLHKDIWVLPDPKNKDWEYGIDWESSKADEVFIHEHLHSWCLWGGLKEYMDRDGKTKKTSLCLGYEEKENGELTNNSVLCRKVFRKPHE